MARKILNEILKRIEEEVSASSALGLRYVLRTDGTSKTASSETAFLEAVKQEVLSCRRCELARTRTNVVFGMGDPDADILFIGEAPGRNEDIQGLPFVGDAGKLLDKILHAMGLSRSEVYIANILKCRPPGNRNPSPEEIMNCYPYLLRQIDSIRPKIIVALGYVSAKTLLKTKLPMGQLRGNFYDFRNTVVLPTYHPAYLLRNPTDKKKVWEDMQKVLKFLKTGER